MTDGDYRKRLLDRLQTEILFTGNQVATLLGITRSTLRLYHNAGVLPEPETRGSNGARWYRFAEVEQYTALLESLPRGAITRKVNTYLKL